MSRFAVFVQTALKKYPILFIILSKAYLRNSSSNLDESKDGNFLHVALYRFEHLNLYFLS